jgi:hypothetical protein
MQRQIPVPALPQERQVVLGRRCVHRGLDFEDDLFLAFADGGDGIEGKDKCLFDDPDIASAKTLCCATWALSWTRLTKSAVVAFISDWPSVIGCPDGLLLP